MFPDFAIAGAFLIVVSSWQRESRIRDAWISLILMLGASFSLPLMSAGTGFMMHTLDGFLIEADKALGLNTIPLSRLAASTPWLWTLMVWVYASLPLAIAIGWIIDRDARLVKSCAIGALAAPVFYLLFPAVGPAAAFPGWPFAAIQGHSAIMAIADTSLPRNAFPSMHFSWAMMVYVYAGKRWWKAAATVYLFLMAIATMGSGEHYAVDLIGSVLLVWGIDRITTIYGTRGTK